VSRPGRGTRDAGRGRERRATLLASRFPLLVSLLLACSGPRDTSRVPITIPPGATLDAAVDSLAARGIVRYPGAFRWYARIRGLRRSLKSGEYLLHSDATWSDLVSALERGHGADVRWTVPEGLMLAEVAELARADLGIARDSFVRAADDSGLRRELGLPPTVKDLEGYLFPTTYTVHAHPGARELVRIMAHEFAAQWAPEWQARLDTLHMSRHQLVTLASIVEAEVRYEPDRPFVSAVYHNRLRHGMKLDADPTVIYAYGRRLKRVWEKNLTVASPYNTYLHPGLPPGPIAQPGRTSLLAALYPAAVPFLYFVAQPDGKHIFSTTYAEHQAAVRAIKRLQTEARARRPRGR
jgi:UPF0755 protein